MGANTENQLDAKAEYRNFVDRCAQLVSSMAYFKEVMDECLRALADLELELELAGRMYSLR